MKKFILYTLCVLGISVFFYFCGKTASLDQQEASVLAQQKSDEVLSDLVEKNVRYTDNAQASLTLEQRNEEYHNRRFGAFGRV